MLDNSLRVVTVAEPSNRLRIASDVTIQHYDENPFDFLLDDYAVMHPFAYTERDRIELDPFLRSVYPSDRAAVARWVDGFGIRSPAHALTLLDGVNRAIAAGLSYRIREEQGGQSPSLTLQQQSGSCRDFAALFMEACRHLGLASRFVSG